MPEHNNGGNSDNNNTIYADTSRYAPPHNSGNPSDSNGTVYADSPSRYMRNSGSNYNTQYADPNNPPSNNGGTVYADTPSGYMQNTGSMYNNPYGTQNTYNNPPPQQPFMQQPQFSNIPQNPQQPYNRQYAEQPKKKSSTGMIIILIAVIIFFAVVIVSMSTIMKAMLDKGNTKPNTDRDNEIVAEKDDDDDEKTTTTAKTTETETETATTEVTAKPQTVTEAPVQDIPETVTAVVEVEKPKTTKPVDNSFSYTVNHYSLPIYDKPSYDGHVTGRITDRGTHTIVEQSDHWGRLKEGGWIDFSTAETIGYLNDAGYAYITTQKDPLNVRYTPSKNSKVLTSIPKGTQVYVYETAESDWYYTTYNGVSGFISADYISFGQQQQVYNVYYGSLDSLGHNGVWATIATQSDPLNLRSSPSTSAGIITAIPKGTSVYVNYDYDSNWCYVTWGQYSGYVSSQFLAF